MGNQNTWPHGVPLPHGDEDLTPPAVGPFPYGPHQPGTPTPESMNLTVQTARLCQRCTGLRTSRIPGQSVRPAQGTKKGVTAVCVCGGESRANSQGMAFVPGFSDGQRGHSSRGRGEGSERLRPLVRADTVMLNPGDTEGLPNLLSGASNTPPTSAI